MATEQLENLGSEDAKWLGEYSRVHMNVFGTPLRVMDHGEGAHIWDIDGNEYLDFLAGIAVNALGYAHPKWVKAVSEQAAKAAHVSNYFATEPQIELASKLIELAGAPRGISCVFRQLRSGRQRGSTETRQTVWPHLAGRIACHWRQTGAYHRHDPWLPWTYHGRVVRNVEAHHPRSVRTAGSQYRIRRSR
ncbi:aminotransferase, class III [Bifidobacterium pseudocatenulatum DSM 20438 = JCM 1200 = LMG 10505]|uniref:Aminotransferase, class III n=1 Tax=Bifidobacterium pseudocatenulatum DSM 20438 = JCM 1200 = LMG 10505 TaxID=547043 RepID=C0BTT7_BIFPS|nr:aminotransferase, class III [Bifidobacterium pseudocatenulatum DSM 20438 = JCM 1200 = LMG 10505]